MWQGSGSFRKSGQEILSEEMPFRLPKVMWKSGESALLCWKNPKWASAAGTEWAKEKREQKKIRELGSGQIT